MSAFARWSTIGAAFLSALMLCGGCSRDASFQPPFEINPGERFRSDTLIATESGWFNRGSSAGPAWSSTRMVVCNWNGYVSRSFLRFAAFPDTSVTVDSVQLYLWATRIDGDSEAAILDVHALTDTLEQLDLYWGEMPGISEEPIGSFEVKSIAGSVFVDVTDAVRPWIKRETRNFGLALKARDEMGPAVLVEFASREIPVKTINDSTFLDLRPALRIAYTDTAGDDQLAISIAAEDVFADSLFTPFPDDPERLLCGSGFPSRAFVRFDVRQVPEGSTVAKSIMSVTIDSETSSFDSMGITCHAILDYPWEDFETAIGAMGISTITLKVDETWADSTVDMDITNLVQPLIARREANSGFAVKTSNEAFDLDFVRFWSHEQPDSSLRPRLIIDYVLPPSLPYSEEDQP